MKSDKEETMSFVSHSMSFVLDGLNSFVDMLQCKYDGIE